MASTAEKPSVAVAMVASTAVKPGKPSVGVAAALGRILAFASTAGQPSVASVRPAAIVHLADQQCGSPSCTVAVVVVVASAVFAVASVVFGADKSSRAFALRADRAGRGANIAGTTAVPPSHFLASLQDREEQDEIHLQNPCGNQLER